jgi:hypothetical protein
MTGSNDIQPNHLRSLHYSTVLTTSVCVKVCETAYYLTGTSIFTICESH